MLANDVDESKAHGSPLTLDLRAHGVCWTLPHGAVMDGDITLPGGALIFGKFRGRISSAEGSIIFASGSEFMGHATADCIYVEGIVSAVSRSESSELHGRLLVAISERAQGRASIRSRAFSINTSRFAAEIIPLEI